MQHFHEAAIAALIFRSRPRGLVSIARHVHRNSDAFRKSHQIHFATAHIKRLGQELERWKTETK
jgi:hypothetical protein